MPTSQLLSVVQAQALIRERLPVSGSERVPLDQAAGRILRQCVRAERDQPPYDRVMMDGIAVRHAEPFARTYRNAGLQLAGAPGQALAAAGDCLEVTTGAVLPPGCDTVIPVERIRAEGALLHVEEGYAPAAGQFVHRRGADCRAGEALLAPGARLRGPEIAILAANGLAEVEVARAPRVAVIATGDELVEVDAPVSEWQIRRSNDRALAAALRDRGIADIAFAQVGDDLAATTELLAAQLAEREVLVLTGGVSMGQRDYVPAALRALGVEQVFHKIAQRPGKPMWFGIGPRGQAVFGLPGNPVSALVCHARYVLPGLLAAMGATVAAPPPVILAEPLDTSPDLACFVPVALRHEADGRTVAEPLRARTSGDFSVLARTDGFVELPPGPGHFPAGHAAPFHRW
jgi:molybdopterin molybdotransferase